MKKRATVVLVCILAAVGLAVCLVLEHQACLKLDAENDVLRRQLSNIGEVTADKQRLSNLLSQANARRQRAIGTTSTNVVLDKNREELARLRRQLEALRQQSNDVETLRADTGATCDTLKQAHDARRASRLISHNNPGAAGDAPFQVLQASYGTDHTNLDVSAELNDRIRNGSVKAIANNNLAGDPDFGIVKSLTVVYRSGGTVMTNQFREGDVIILPPESP